MVFSQDDGLSQKLEFDEVVVAVPLGCLKRKNIEFSAPLPPDICTAIENASISSLEKIFVTFPAAFWDGKGDTKGNESGDEDFPGFANFLSTSYGLESHKSFALEVNSLSSTSTFGRAAQSTLLFTLFGDSGQALTSAINPLTPSDEAYYSLVDDFVKPYYSLLPNYDPENPRCVPSAVLATNWQNDDLAGNGSYTNFKVSEVGKVVNLDAEVRAMREGMPERGIWFAGEHVAPFIGLGTSTGAYWSGEAAAMRILAANGLASDSYMMGRA